MIAKFVAAWRSQPKVRFFVRTVLAAVGGYIVSAWASGGFSWHDLIGAGIGAGVHAVVGWLTPVEPNVGVKAKVTS